MSKKWFIRIIVFILLIFISTCGKNTSTVTTQPANGKMSIVCLVGGLGYNQLSTDIQTQLESVNNLDIINMSTWDGWHYNPVSTIISERTKYPNSTLTFVGHSYGGASIFDFANELNVDGIIVNNMVTIDPVLHGSESQLVVPPNVQNFEFYRPSHWTLGIAEASVEGQGYILISGDHNSITHDPQVINAIVTMISQ